MPSLQKRRDALSRLLDLMHEEEVILNQSLSFAFGQSNEGTRFLGTSTKPRDLRTNTVHGSSYTGHT